ncbi:MAG TPA: sigma-70 family RNA polymerase sigma factor [Phycisphaerales bacterium]|nr:sigma-70 family RNA polymerase sigma factor [Phycisphaerales bacterium]
MIGQTTHISLLARLGEGADPLAWAEFCHRYGELIRNFARSRNLQPADCDDVLQDVLMALTRSMPGFEYDPSRGKFRSYLKTVTLHAIFARSRQNHGQAPLREVEAAAARPDIESSWDEQWRQYHLRQAMNRIEAEFNESDLAAFTQYALNGRSAKDTAGALGLSLDQVYQAKSRILKRLSTLIDEQVEEEG